MRNLFLMLVLANLAFAAWHQWLAEPPARGLSAADREVEGITLVGETGAPGSRDASPSGERVPAGAAGIAEVGAAPVSAAATADATADADDAVERRDDADLLPERCVSVGPFRELAQAAAATSNLRAAGHMPRQRVLEGEIWQGYWVHLDGFPSAEQANEVLAELRSHGFTDSYVIRGSETNLISLGLFTEISRAGRHREALRELGYDPAITDRTGRATVYWVDVTLAPEQTLNVEALQTPGRIIRLEQRPCE